MKLPGARGALGGELPAAAGPRPAGIVSVVLPLAVSGPIVIGVAILSAVALIIYLFRLEAEGEALELAEEEAAAAADAEEAEARAQRSAAPR